MLCAPSAYPAMKSTTTNVYLDDLVARGLLVREDPA